MRACEAQLSGRFECTTALMRALLLFRSPQDAWRGFTVASACLQSLLTKSPTLITTYSSSSCILFLRIVSCADGVERYH